MSDVAEKIWQAEWREQQRERFVAQGLPTRKDEHWKYTNVRALSDYDLLTPAPYVQGGLDFSAYLLPDCFHVVFVNGRCVKNDCDQAGVRVSDAPEDLPAAEIVSSEQQSVFAALNAAMFQTGAVIHIDKNIIVSKPIQVLHISTTQRAEHLRHSIVAEDNSAVTVFEQYVGDVDAAYFNNVVTHIMAKPGAGVEHYKYQHESPAAHHIATLDVQQHKDSAVNLYAVNVGAKLGREDIHIRLAESGATCKMMGFYQTRDKQLLDTHSVVEHCVPHCTSEQHYKGIMSGDSIAVFNGKVHVHEKAQDTKAFQTNNNLLLSKNADINTKPELEIYADDVKCSHGATVGQLDEQALFYLQSRGLEAEVAKALLTQAFANDILDKMPNPIFRALVSKEVPHE